MHEQICDDALAWSRADGPATAAELSGCLDLENTWTGPEPYELQTDNMRRASDTRQDLGPGRDPQRLRTLLGLT